MTIFATFISWSRHHLYILGRPRRWLCTVLLAMAALSGAAQELVLGQRSEGVIPEAGTVPYTVTIEEEGTYVVSVFGAFVDRSRWSLNYPAVLVRDEDGGQVAHGDWLAPGFSAPLEVFLAPGTYGIDISDSDSWGGSGDTFSVAVFHADTYYANLPAIWSHPDSIQVYEGDDAWFYVSADDSQTLTYQWIENSWPNWGENDSSFAVWGVQQWQDGTEIQVVVSNEVAFSVSDYAYISIGTVQELAVGAVIEGYIHQEYTTDRYRMTIPESGDYLIEARGYPEYDLEYVYLTVESEWGDYLGSTGGYGYALLPVYLEAGDHFVEVGGSGSVGSYAISLRPGEEPIIQSHPQAVTVDEGTTATFQVSAIGGTLSYQWHRNGQPIDGATDSNLTIAATTELNGSFYAVQVTNAVGSTWADAALLTVRSVHDLVMGGSLDGLIDPLGDVDVYRIQVTQRWGYQFDAFAGNRDAQYTLSHASIELLNSDRWPLETRNDVGSSTFARIQRTLDPGTYYLRVRASTWWAANQLTGTYQVAAQEIALPTITTHPLGLTLTEGNSATFSVEATSTAPLSYRWLRNGVELPLHYSNTSTQYTVVASEALNGSVYQVRVSNLAGSVLSEEAVLQVVTAPTLTVPGSVQASIDPAGEVDWYRVTVTEAGGYRIHVAGQFTGNGNTLSRPQVHLFNEQAEHLATGFATSTRESTIFWAFAPGSYLISVRAVFSHVSGTYTLSLDPVDPPVITQQPVSVAIVEGQTARFAVTASSVAPLNYRWILNGVVQPATTNSIYTIPLTDLASNESSIHVEVMNVAGAVVSDSALLSVAPAPTLAVGQSIDANINVGNDVHWYRITIPTTGVYYFQAATAPVGGLSYPRVQIRSATGGLMQTGSNGYTQSQMAIALEAGSYIVAVSSFYGFIGNYSVSAHILAPPEITQHPQSLVMSEGQSASLTVIATSLVWPSFQWYRDGVAIPWATISTHNLYANPSLDGAVFTVEVSNLAGTVLSDPATIQVPMPLPIALDQTIEAEIAPVGNVDWYQITIPTTGGYQIDVAGAGTDSDRWTLADPRVFVWTMTGQHVGSDDDSGPGSDASLSVQLHAAQTYLIEVRSTPSDGVGTYALSIRQFPPPTIVEQPATVTAVVGETVTFSVVATGSGRLTFQWYQNGIFLSNQRARALTVTANELLDGSLYRVTVTNEAGSVVSDSATLHVQTGIAQIITGFEPFASYVYGDAPFLITGVSGGGSGNPVVLTSGNPSIASVLGAQVTMHRAGTVTITATQAGAGLYAPAVPVSQTLVIAQLPQTIDFAPLGSRPYGTSPITLSASASSGLPVSYTVISGPVTINGNILTIANSGEAVIAAVQAGDVNYTAAAPVQRTLTITPSAPEFATQPESQDVPLGGTATLTTSLINPVAASYQWFHQGIAITGAIHPHYVVTVADAAAEGDYHVVATNPFGSTPSALARVTGVQTPVVITTQPSSTITMPAGGESTVSVVAQGSMPITYQWFRNGEPLMGANASSYTVTAPTVGEDGLQLQVEVTNAVNTVRSEIVTVTVYGPPVITVAPVDRTVYEGSPASFSVAAIGQAPLTYRWYRDGEAIANAMQPHFNMQVVADADDGASFTVTVNNAAGTTTAGPVVLRVLPRIPQIITGFGPFSPQIVGDPDILLNGVIGGGSGHQVTFTSSDSNIAWVGWPSRLHIRGAGTVHITANQAGSVLYAPAEPVTQTLIIERGPQSIAFAVLRPVPFGTEPFPLTATASSGLPVAFAIVDGPATMIDGAIAIDDVGAVTIRATQEGNSHYSPAPEVTRTLVVEPAVPMITQHPQGVMAPSNSTHPLTVTVTNSRHATYQWFRNGIALADTNTPEYAVVVPAPGLTAHYRVEVTNAVGSVVSDTAVVRGFALHPGIITQPQPATRYPGESITFEVVAVGTGPLSYQWFRDGETVADATAQIWTLDALRSVDDGAQIRVEVTNAIGTAVSSTVTLRIHGPPQITQHPEDTSVEVGRSAAFTATVNSTLDVSRQWTRNGVAISTATAAAYTLKAATLIDDGAVFRLIVSNELGSVVSDPAVLHVRLAPPLITVHPRSVEVHGLGEEAVFTVAATSPLPLTYTWYRNGLAVPGATTDRLSFSVTDTDVGAVFMVRVSNEIGGIDSLNATISRTAPPRIVQQPVDREVGNGGEADFSVTAESFDPQRTLLYQWQRNDIDIPGATTRTFQVSAVSAADHESRFAVRVSDGAHVVFSRQAILRVRMNPVIITTQPSDVTGDLGVPVTFSVGVTGDSPRTYQWFRDGQAIPGAVEQSYVTTPVLAGDFGAAFSVHVSNPFGEAVSEMARIRAEPEITLVTSDPQRIHEVTVMPLGDPITFRVQARGERPFIYRWYRDAVLIPNADSETLVLPAVTLEDDGVRFTVRVINTAGEDERELPRFYVTTAPPLIISQPRDAQVPLGQSATFSVSVDTTGQIPFTLQWYRDDVAIEGATTSQLLLHAVSEADDAARFHVVATNRFGSVVSRTARVMRPDTFVITRQPQSLSVDAGTTATFSVDVNNRRDVHYMWRRNGTMVPTAFPRLSAQHTTGVLTASDSGTIFDVVITSPQGQQLISEAVSLTVVDNPPVILTHPQPQRLTVGQNAVFHVTVTGGQPLSFQWYRDGLPIPDQNFPSLSVPILSLADQGSVFHIVVTNKHGSVTSSTAALTVSAIPVDVISDPDIIAEVRGTSVLIHPRAVVSNGDQEGITYGWGQQSGPSVSPVQRHPSHGSARLELSDLQVGEYAFRCTATYLGTPYGIQNPPILASTSHVFRFRVVGPLEWITPPRGVGTLSPSMTMNLEAVAGFSGIEDPVTSYSWAQIDGPPGVQFIINDLPAAAQTQVLLPEAGRYTLACTADWRGTTLVRAVVIDTAATSDPDGLAKLSGRTLLVAASPFDSARWYGDEHYRTTYAASVEPGRVWQTAPPGPDRQVLRASDPLRLRAVAGETVTVRVRAIAGAPVSWASLHGGFFVANQLNALTVIAGDDGEAEVSFQVPTQSGTYSILTASPLTVGRLAFTVVVP